jgi:hypothetical protein
MQVGDETCPAHPEEHEIVVFFGMDRPERDYRVIGMLYIEENVNSWDDDWVRHLQQAARRHGADAILDVRTPEAKGVFLEASTSQMEAKAIVFVDEP